MTEPLDDLLAQREQAWKDLQDTQLDWFCWSATIARSAVEDGCVPSEGTAEKWRRAKRAYDAAKAQHRELCDRLSEAYAARMASKSSGVATVPAPSPA